MAPSATLGLSDPFSSSPFCSLVTLDEANCHSRVLCAACAAECSPDAHCRYSGMSQPDCVASPGLHRPNSPISQPACCSFAHNDLVGERGDACSYENPPHVVYSLCRVRYERPRPCRWILTLPHEVRPVLIWSAAISFVSEDHGVSCVLNVPRSSITCFDCVSARTSCPPLTAQ